jgi:ribosome maturation factor RimP
MADGNREAITNKVTQIAERVGAGAGIEIVDVQMLGGGGARLLRIYIDRPAGSIDRPAGSIDRPAGSIDRPAGSMERSSAHESAEAVGQTTADAERPGGVTLADCEFISQNVGTILDVEDVIPGQRYTLEVSSPGVERKLTKPRDFERFVGQKVKVALRQPVENQRTWVGALASFAEGMITLEPSPGRSIRFPLDQVEKANLKFEW